MNIPGRSCLELAHSIELDWQVNLLEARRLPSIWRYKTIDPYAVTVTFEPDTKHELDWRFGRDLVYEALTTQKLGAVGMGDVRLPIQDPNKTPPKPNLPMHLVDRDGVLCKLTVPRVALEAFLAQSQVLVPLGAESSIVSTEIESDLTVAFADLSSPE